MINIERVREVLSELVKEEVETIIEKHGYYKNNHEVLGVLWEELYEVKQEGSHIAGIMENIILNVTSKKSIDPAMESLRITTSYLIAEAIQIIAICEKYFLKERDNA